MRSPMYPHERRPPASASPKPVPPPRQSRRPRGLWKARVTHHAPTVPLSQHAHGVDAHHLCNTPGSSIGLFHKNAGYYSDSDELDSSCSSASSSCSKRARLFSDEDEERENESRDHYEYSRPLSPSPLSSGAASPRESCWTRRTRIMDTSTTAGRGAQTELRQNCSLEDWEDLKDLFGKAAEQYENNGASEALPLIRGVVHECHRFLLCYQDPSVLFAMPSKTADGSTDILTVPLEERTNNDSCCNPTSRPIRPRRKCTCVELPTAFHAILGTALFMFGNLIAQDPALALAGEPDSPSPYWLAALDVFETGENLPSRINGYGCEAPEDWRMAIVWGRTLVCIADEIITRARKAQEKAKPGSLPAWTADFIEDEPNWPSESPFSAIAARRPPVTRRMSMASASAHDLMLLAMDQFSRGIFHMPHPQHVAEAVLDLDESPDAAISPTAVSAGLDQHPFSRAKELFTIASEVLLVAEKMDGAEERRFWASWADSVFNQMKMEADMDAWRGAITRARGRCWLTVGSAHVEEIEEALEQGDGEEVLRSDDAEDAREGLATAVEFFERARGSASTEPEEWTELKPLLAEALLTLANLTIEEDRREDLYTRAAELGVPGLDAMECD